MRACYPIVAVLLLLSAGLACAAGLDDLDKPQPFRAERSSSADPNWENGNGDCRGIAPGDTLTLAELTGPGRITHIWFTISDKERWYPRLLTLRMYWDGEETPSVECPIGDFFAVGHGLDREVNSLPVRITSNGRARNCYWPMPFGKSARITVTNEGKERMGCIFWYIDWQRLPRLARGTPYFHAQYRQEFPCVAGRDYLIFDGRGRGHYVGTVLSVICNEASWWGEGDDRFFIDGEDEPSLKGTGSEDYFCDAWGIRERQGPYYGCSVMEGLKPGDRTTAYRWHITDPVPFRESLRVTIEHKGARVGEDGKHISGFTERADDFSSVAFWYQVEPHHQFAEYPPGEARLPFAQAATTEAETLLPPHEIAGGPVQVQRGVGSGAGQVFFTPAEQEASITLAFDVAEAGRRGMVLSLTRSWDYGIYRISLDGRVIANRLDLYNPSVDVREHKVGEQDLTAGRHLLRFECIGRNAASKGYYLGVDAILLMEATAKP